jgi:hypothetical protein
LLAARFGLALAQAQHVRHLQTQCQLVQRILLDQVGTHTREIALGQIAQPLVKQAGHSQIEHRIAQKLQAFIVVCRKTAVRDGTLQQ